MLAGEEEQEADDDPHHDKQAGLGEYVVQLGRHVEPCNYDVEAVRQRPTRKYMFTYFPFSST